MKVWTVVLITLFAILLLGLGPAARAGGPGKKNKSTPDLVRIEFYLCSAKKRIAGPYTEM
jgi:hypothetical protein